MSSSLENQVRVQQLRLLRLEKKIRNLAPVALATGLSLVAIESARNDLAALNQAPQLFDKVDEAGEVSRQIAQADEKLSIEIGNLGVGVDPQKRLESLSTIVNALDTAHHAAEVASLRRGIRLLGQRLSIGKRADGGTPKEDPPNYTWFKALVK